MELEGWEILREPIDTDIDEGDYINEGTSLINTVKKKMIRQRYKCLGTKIMRKQKIEGQNQNQ